MPAPTSPSPKQFLFAAHRQWRDLVQRCVFRLERERRAQMIAVVALVVVCTSVFAESVTTARSEQQRWSSNISVVVLTADLPANGVLTADNTKQISLPRALLTEDALTALPSQSRTRIALTANTPLSKSLVIPSSESITIPDGWRVIALPQDITTPHLVPGDAVDVVIGESVVATACLVISLKPLSLALPATVIPAVTAASRVGEVFIAAQK